MTALAAVIHALRCPVCAGTLSLDDRRVVCTAGHSYDVARQGYVQLTTGYRGPGTGDTAEMVAARAEFLDRGYFDLIADAVATAARPDGLIADLAGGTGYYLATVLDRAPAASGVCLDLSAAALRRAARAHPRAAAIGADAWRRLPLGDSTVDVALSVFGPRDAAELDRVLTPAGRVVVVAPTGHHLLELSGPMGMIGIDPDKAARQAVAFAGFTVERIDRLSYRRTLDQPAVAAAVTMGPTGAHADAATIARRAAALPARVDVTVEVEVTTYVR